jgi:hypothetical protein
MYAFLLLWATKRSLAKAGKNGNTNDMKFHYLVKQNNEPLEGREDRDCRFIVIRRNDVKR